ncbi:hypothetical protein NDU88_007472 [Pleurodeles waltl]|uniref:Uncharacterized protein n=1 Tax=Pleurodeles waltl TaxID=8319 RepID=A0AAV7LS58_PLEWA|nr:hypothetical protein NDU88_007472 [Pleurodeles waltl]
MQRHYANPELNYNNSFGAKPEIMETAKASEGDNVLGMRASDAGKASKQPRADGGRLPGARSPDEKKPMALPDKKDILPKPIKQQFGSLCAPLIIRKGVRRRKTKKPERSAREENSKPSL